MNFWGTTMLLHIEHMVCTMLALAWDPEASVEVWVFVTVGYSDLFVVGRLGAWEAAEFIYFQTKLS